MFDNELKPEQTGQFFYSNTNYLLLGYIAEKIEKQPLSQIMEQRIFAPLHLSNTFLIDAASKPNRVIDGYDRDMVPYPGMYKHKGKATALATSISGAGGMVSTALDWSS